MEEEDQKMKHVCKWCNKRYPCGRSLGGHMRSHIIANSAEAEEEANPNLDKSSPLSKRDHSGVVANEQSGYGLRQNPRKTWRLVDSSSALENGMLYCKECGKGFQSLKALCGHMACHSEKERPMNNIEDHSWTNADRDVVMDSQSDTETAAPRRQRRSRRTRYKTLDVNSFSLGNASSSVSETEQEQEEVAMCLMMLSKDSGNWGDFNSVAESSDNNYGVLETGSLSIDMRIAKKGLNSVYNVDEKKKPGGKKLKSGAFDAEVVHFGKFSDSGHFRSGGRKLNSSAFDPEEVHFENSDSGFFRSGVKNLVHFENSDSGFFGNGAKNLKFGSFDDEGFHCENSDSGHFRNGAKKVESDGSFDSILRKGEFMKHKGEGGSGFGILDAEFGKRDVRRLNCTKTELLKNLIKEEGYNHADRALVRHDSGKLWEVSYKNSQKRGKFECLTCNKVFKSHQALGGHIASHRKANGSVASTYESGENSMETDIYSDQMLDSKLIDNCSGQNLINQSFSGNAERKSVSKKRKGHKCPICFKVFRSGQALGGHKRSHLAGGSDDKSNRAAVIKRDPPEILFDLNLPAPIETEANEHASFMPW